MQAATASDTHVALLTRSKTSHNDQDRVEDLQADYADSRHTFSPVYPSPTLVPNPLLALNTELDQSTHVFDNAPIDPSSKSDTAFPRDIKTGDDALLVGMSSTQELFQDAPQVVLESLRLPNAAVRTHSIKSDLTPPPSKDVTSEGAEAAKDNGDDDESNEAILQSLATHRMAVMGLRSEAQQQGKDLRRLHQQFLDDTSSIVDALKHTTTGDFSEGSPPLTEQVTTLAKLQLSIESARKSFHNSLELLLRNEWRLKEEEDRLYTRYTGQEAGSILSDELSKDYSELPSVSASVPVSLDEPQTGPEDRNEPVFSSQAGGHAESAGFELPSRSENRLAEALVSAPARLDPGVVALSGHELQFAVTSEPSPEPPHTARLSRSMIKLGRNSLQSTLFDGRVTQSSKAPKSRDLNFLGSQFSSEPQYPTSSPHDQFKQVVLSSENSSASDYSLPRLSRWFAFGVPWNSLTRGRRLRPYRLPDGVSPWQAMAINHYGATALGVPISGQLDLSHDTDARQSATRRSLLQSWFCDPKTRSDISLSSVAEAEEAEKAASEATSAKKTPIAATMPCLGGSLSPSVLLEDGGNLSAILDRRSRFTAAAHTAQSELAFFKRPSQRRNPKH